MKTILVFLCTLFASLAYAVPALNESNDYFSSFLSPSDENLTQSLEISSTRKYDDTYEWLRYAASLLPRIACGSACPRHPDLVGVGFGQQIWTPDDKHLTVPDPRDEPYAGWMYVRLTRMNMMPTERISTSLYVGMIGPSALGEQTQNGFHDILGQTHFEGWSNQLHNEPAFYLSHKRGFIDYRVGDAWGAIVLTTIEGNLGTVHTDTTLKEELRAGYNLRGYNLDNKEFSVYGFLRPRVSGILRNIFFDGNTYLDSVRVRKENFQAGLEGGVGVEYYGWRIMYILNFTTKDFETQDEAFHGTGSIRIEKLFE
jgi:lipid A 3-O-deacylase